MSQKKTPLLLISILIFFFATSVVSIFIIIKQHRRIRMLEHSRITLAEGEEIRYFDLIGTDNNQVDASVLKDGHISLLFIFKHPCVPCNHNLTLWRRMAKILKDDQVTVYGIWLGSPSEMFEFADNAKLGFKLFSPVDVEKFKNQLKLNLNYARTILYADNQILAYKLANLEGEDYSSMLRQIKKIIKEKSIP